MTKTASGCSVSTTHTQSVRGVVREHVRGSNTTISTLGKESGFTPTRMPLRFSRTSGQRLKLSCRKGVTRHDHTESRYRHTRRVQEADHVYRAGRIRPCSQ